MALRYYGGSDKALLYDDFIALRDGKMTEERAKELGLSDFKEVEKTSPLGSLHGWKGGGRMPEECPCGVNNTADNW